MEESLTYDNISFKEIALSTIETDDFWFKEGEFTAVIAEELADLHVHIKLFNKESSTPLKKVTKISKECEVLCKKTATRNTFRKYINCFKFTAAQLAFRLLQKGV